jgi:hypothetical protein
MNQTEPKFIGKSISIQRGRDFIEVRISQKILRWQESLLFVWLLGWTFCGSVFIYYALEAEASSDRLFFIICSSLWLFFFVRITKVFLWRRGGVEILRISPGKFTIRNAFWNFGKIQEFHLNHVFKLGMQKKSATSFLAFLDDSFWIMGGDRLGFSYSGQQIQFAKQLTTRDAELLLRVIDGAIREHQKKAQ